MSDYFVSMNGHVVTGGIDGFAALLKLMEEEAGAKNFAIDVVLRRSATMPGMSNDVLQSIRNDHAAQRGPLFEVYSTWHCREWSFSFIFIIIITFILSSILCIIYLIK